MTDEQIQAIPDDLLIDGDWETREVYINGKELKPKRSQKVCNHSPDGFNWGYSGSGPAQLALAILLKYLPKEGACNLYQRFKFRVVAGWPRSDFEVRLNLRETIQTLIKERENAK